jgi:hypothetical protein
MRWLTASRPLRIPNFFNERRIEKPAECDGLSVESGFWKIIWIDCSRRRGRWLASISAMFSPAMRISPAVARSRPAMMRARVDLPQPDSPTSATISALPAVKETSSFAVTVLR